MIIFLKRIIERPLYFLQLENYELLRYWRLLFKKMTHPGTTVWRQDLVWTAKMRAVFILSIVFQALAASAIAAATAWWLGLVCFLLFFLFLPIFITLGCIILWPIDLLFKSIIINRARRKLGDLPELKIVAVAGSYGKTTMKEALDAVLAAKYKTLVTPENINTPLGIARLILKKLDADTHIFIVEMGEYYRGDIRVICRLVRPDVAVVTGINEAHLERLKNLGTTTATIFEVVENANPNALVVLNADDVIVHQKADQFLGGRPAVWYSARSTQPCAFQIVNSSFDPNGGGQQFDILEKENLVGHFSVSLLAEYAAGVAVASLIVGRHFNIEVEKCTRALAVLKSVPHRLQLLRSPSDVLVVDDSYNGNPSGVAEAIKVLAKFKDRRKIFLTPGLVEMGLRSETVHKKIGEELAEVANLVILIKNSVTPIIAESLIAKGFAKESILWFNTAPEAHQALATILKPHDVILFQNDWGDNYL